jgi:hypothetical protein
MQSQKVQIVVCLGVSRLELNRLLEAGAGQVQVPPLGVHQTEVVVERGIGRFAENCLLHPADSCSSVTRVKREPAE